MKRWRWLLCAVMMMPLWAQAPAKPDPFASLDFLQGTWDAKSSGQGGATESFDATSAEGAEVRDGFFGRPDKLAGTADRQGPAC